MSSSTRPTVGSDTIASLMVAAFSLAVAVGFARVFSGWPFVTDMAVIAVAGHGTGLVLRRLRVPGWIAVPATAIVLVWTVLAVYYPSTFSWAMPTSDTWSILRIELTSVRQDFRTAVAPVEYGGGWNVLAAIGLATSVLLADVFAFRADARAETLVPGGVLFVFVGALGDERLRVASAVLLVGAGVVTTMILRWYHAEPGRADVVSSWRRWPVAISFGVVIAIVAGVVGPRLPGADAAPLYETSGGGGGLTQVVSPLVDIRSRVTNRSTVELFRVSADVESYWRSATLSEFDGTTWGVPERELRPLDESATAPAESDIDNSQRITIGALGGTFIPAAADPYQASPQPIIKWLRENSTLVWTSGDLETGDTIDIVSTSPKLDPERLAAATSDQPGDPIYTSLPADLPDVVKTTALRVTSGARNTYEKALLLQAWFHREFRYSLDVKPGHGNSAIETFLENRVGYCEQFAGTYAAMMRTLDIPARVAVGFTSGVPLGDGEFSVLGRNAHAWPEVWFDGIGWVGGFEPTPGRGNPNAENYTRLPPQQDDSATADDIGDPASTPATTLPSGSTDDQSGLEIPDFSGSSGDTSTPTTGSGAAAGNAGNTVPWLVVAAIVLLAAVLAAPSGLRLLRRRSKTRSDDEQIADAWQRATGAVSAVGVPLRPSDTPIEIAASTARHFPRVTRPMTSLADAVTEATYRASGSAGFGAAGDYGTSAVAECRHWAKQIDRAATESLAWPERVQRYFTTWR